MKLLVYSLLLSVLSLLIKTQIKDYSLDEDDDFIKDYENFNINYNKIKERQNKIDYVWNKPITQNKLNQREIEDQYFQEKNINSEKYNLEELAKQARDNPNADEAVFSQFKPNRNSFGGHPGMNMDRVINKNFNNHKSQINIDELNRINGVKLGWFNTILNLFNYQIYGYSISEYFLCFMIVSFLYFHFVGKTFNDKYAQAWYDANRNYFESKFNRLGVKPEIESIKNNTDLIKDANNLYKYHVEDYLNINTLTAILEFKNKQNTAALVSGIFVTITDKIYYKVNIKPVEPSPCVFCIGRKSEIKSITSSYKDIVSI